MGNGVIISIEELKKIQLDILSAVDEFCEVNGIRYSMGCGTLLGAIRHKGYIPWDDDIDIYMLREDYNAFLKAFPERYKGKYSLSCIERSVVDRVYASVFDSRTVIVEDSATKNPIGVFIDLFPIDDVPDEEKRWLSFKRKLFYISWLRNIKVLQWHKSRGLVKNFSLYLCKLLLLPIPLKSILDYMNCFVQKHNGKGSHMVYESSYGVGYENPFKKALFDEIIVYPFEDRLFKGFKNADEYLSNTFGSYMQLPPEDKRVSTHSFYAYWK